MFTRNTRKLLTVPGNQGTCCPRCSSSSEAQRRKNCLRIECFSIPVRCAGCGLKIARSLVHPLNSPLRQGTGTGETEAPVNPVARQPRPRPRLGYLDREGSPPRAAPRETYLEDPERVLPG